MKTIQLIAVDIDGVLLEDTFSPIIKRFISRFNVEYSREIERNVFSRPQREAAEYLSKILGIDSDSVIKGYFQERDDYLKMHGCGVNKGIPELLKLFATLNVHLIFYGGLTEDQISNDFKKYRHYFEQYICTNDFRPGIKEITKDIYGLEFNQVLFIDDVNTVAEVAKANNVPFIGVPSSYPWGFQKQDMMNTGVKYLLNSIPEINLPLLEMIDDEAFRGTSWTTNLSIE